MTELEMQSSTNEKAQQLIIILDEVRSMHNVGSVFRTSDAFGVTAIFLCGYTPQPPHRDIHKTALGATETVPWQHFTTTQSAIEAAKIQGYKIYAVEQTTNSIALQHIEKNNETKIALVFGNEVGGVQDDILKMVDNCLEIPQWGAKHSLNISVAVGVCLWELVRNKN